MLDTLSAIIIGTEKYRINTESESLNIETIARIWLRLTSVFEPQETAKFLTLVVSQ